MTAMKPDDDELGGDRCRPVSLQSRRVGGLQQKTPSGASPSTFWKSTFASTGLAEANASGRLLLSPGHTMTVQLTVSHRC